MAVPGSRRGPKFCRTSSGSAAVIHVRVAQHDGRQGARVDRQRAPVAQPQLLQALEEPAVEQHLLVAGAKQMLRAGDGPGRAEELEGWRSRRDRDLQHAVAALAEERVGLADAGEREAA